jgi:methionine sulfoxide reductase heme-binding subunit
MPGSTSTSSCEAEASSLASRVVPALRAANRHPRALAGLGWALAALPALLLANQVLRGTLGTNPLEILVRRPGHWALVLLTCVLGLTPLRHALVAISRWRGSHWGRRFSDWNWLVYLRRPLGLASFVHATAHLALYAWLDLDLEWHEFVQDLQSKPCVLAGIAAFLLLVPLAVTSTNAWMRRLKRNWKRLHWLVYPAALLAALHFIWLSKPGVIDPCGYAGAIVALLAYRVVARWRPAPGAPAIPEAEAAERQP